MDRKKQIERKKQIRSIIRYIEGQKKNGRRTAELKELIKELTEINSIFDYSSTSSNNSSIRSSWVTSKPYPKLTFTIDKLTFATR